MTRKWELRRKNIEEKQLHFRSFPSCTAQPRLEMFPLIFFAVSLIELAFYTKCTYRVWIQYSPCAGALPQRSTSCILLFPQITHYFQINCLTILYDQLVLTVNCCRVSSITTHWCPCNGSARADLMNPRILGSLQVKWEQNLRRKQATTCWTDWWLSFAGQVANAFKHVHLEKWKWIEFNLHWRKSPSFPGLPFQLPWSQGATLANRC